MSFLRFFCFISLISSFSACFMLTQNASIMRLHLVIVFLVKSSILALNNLEFNPELAKFALDFAGTILIKNRYDFFKILLISAGAYGDYPVQCHTKRNSTLIFRYGKRCDAFHNEVIQFRIFEFLCKCRPLMLFHDPEFAVLGNNRSDRRMDNGCIQRHADEGAAYC